MKNMKKSIMLIIGCLFFHYNMAQELEVMSESQRLGISQEEYDDMVKHSNNEELILQNLNNNKLKNIPLKRGEVKFDLFKESMIPEINYKNKK